MLLKCPHWKTSTTTKERMQAPTWVCLQVYKILLNTLSNEVHECFWILVNNTCCFNVKFAFTVKVSKNWCSYSLREGGEWLGQGNIGRTRQVWDWIPRFLIPDVHFPPKQAAFPAGRGYSFPTLLLWPHYWGSLLSSDGKPLLSCYQYLSIGKFNTINS